MSGASEVSGAAKRVEPRSKRSHESYSYHNTVEWRSREKLSQIMFLQEARILPRLAAGAVVGEAALAAAAVEAVQMETGARKSTH